MCVYVCTVYPSQCRFILRCIIEKKSRSVEQVFDEEEGEKDTGVTSSPAAVRGLKGGLKAHIACFITHILQKFMAVPLRFSIRFL